MSSTKLEKLTKEQEALIPVVRDEWIKFCLGGNTDLNRQMASDGIRWIYGLAKLDAPFIIFVDGPMACQYAVAFIKAMMKNKKLTDQVRDQVRDQVGDQVGNQVWNQVRDQVGNQVGNQVWNQVGNQVGNQVWNQVGDQVWNQVGDQVRDQVGNQVGDQVWNQVGDQLKNPEYFAWCDLSDSGWVGFYDFFDRIGIKVTDDLKKYRDYIKSGTFFTIFLNGVAIACQRPSVVHRNKENRLHKDLAPAIEWKGEQYFFLNGVRMKKEQVLAKPEEIDVQQIVKEENAEVRRELIRKVGVERFIQKAGAKVLDKRGEYELLSVRLSDEVPDARYLKMLNPSIGVWHVEGVEGNTVEEAINFRAGRVISKGEKWEPVLLS